MKLGASAALLLCVLWKKHSAAFRRFGGRWQRRKPLRLSGGVFSRRFAMKRPVKRCAARSPIRISRRGRSYLPKPRNGATTTASCRRIRIHPEVFDRLYEDWTTIDGFQRTRGVLKLMAKVIYRLWKDDNKDLLIMPGSVPLHDGSSRNELTYYLPAGWDAVIERDIDGERAETTALESQEPRFGQVGAARRIARTIFLGSAPASVVSKTAVRGLGSRTHHPRMRAAGADFIGLCRCSQSSF